MSYVTIGIYLENRNLYKDSLEDFISILLDKLFYKNSKFIKSYVYDELKDEEFEISSLRNFINKVYSYDNCYNYIEYSLSNKKVLVNINFINNDLGLDFNIKYDDLIEIFKSEKQFINYFKEVVNEIFLDKFVKYIFISFDEETEYSYNEIKEMIKNGNIKYSTLFINDDKHSIYKNGYDLQGIIK